MSTKKAIRRKRPLSEQNLKVLQFILHFQERYGFSPSVAEIMRRLKFQSTCVVYHHLRRLERAEYIKRYKYRARGIVILDLRRSVEAVNNRRKCHE